jgi:hypothetical protein
MWHHVMREMVGSQCVVPLWEEDCRRVFESEGHLAKLSQLT